MTVAVMVVRRCLDVLWWRRSSFIGREVAAAEVEPHDNDAGDLPVAVAHTDSAHAGPENDVHAESSVEQEVLAETQLEDLQCVALIGDVDADAAASVNSERGAPSGPVGTFGFLV